MPNIPLDILADFLCRLREKHPLYLKVWANILADWAENIEPTIDELTVEHDSDNTTMILCIGFGTGLLSKMGVNITVENNKLLWQDKPRKKIATIKQRASGNKTTELVKFDNHPVKQQEGLWATMISIYQDFLKKHNLPSVEIHQSNLKHLKSIKEKLNERSVIFIRQNMKIEQEKPFKDLPEEIQNQLADKIEKAILYIWKTIFERWSEYDDFIQNGKNISQINYNLNNIFDTLQKNGKTAKQQKHASAIERAKQRDYSELARNRQKGSN
jgi:hypothetical protein